MLTPLRRIGVLYDGEPLNPTSQIIIKINLHRLLIQLLWVSPHFSNEMHIVCWFFIGALFECDSRRDPISLDGEASRAL